MKNIIISLIMIILFSFAGSMAYSFYKLVNNMNDYFIVSTHLAIHQLADKGCKHLEGLK